MVVLPVRLAATKIKNVVGVETPAKVRKALAI